MTMTTTKRLFNALTYIQYNDSNNNNLTWIFFLHALIGGNTSYKTYTNISTRYSLNYIVITIIEIFTCRRLLKNENI